MKSIRVYVSTDGRQFATQAECRQHEVETETKQELQRLLANSLQSTQTRSGPNGHIIMHMVAESADIIRVLAKFRQRTRKSRKPTCVSGIV